MCLAIPMQVKKIEGFDARCSVRGVERDVSLFMLQDEPVTIGDWVLVHVGYALKRVSAEDAALAWEMYDQMLDEDEVGA